MTPSKGTPGALLHAEFDAFDLVASYFPQGELKAPFFMKINALGRATTRPLLVVGDLNTGNQVLDRAAKGLPFDCADQFDALNTEAGMTDLWRRTNGDVREYDHNAQNFAQIDAGRRRLGRIVDDNM